MAQSISNQSIESRNKVLRILDIIYRQKWTILITFLIIFSIVAVYTNSQQKSYEATASLMIKGDNISRGFSTLGLTSGVSKNLMNELEILKSKTLISKLADGFIDRFYLDPETKKDTLLLISETMQAWGITDIKSEKFKDKIISALAAASSFTIGTKNDIVTISVTSHSPDEAALIANVYADMYYSEDLARSRINATEVRRFLENQNGKLLDRLQGSERLLQEYMENEGVAGLAQRSTSLVNKITELESELEKNEIEYQKTQLLLNNYKKELARVKPGVMKDIVAGDDMYIRELRGRIGQLEAERDVSKITSIADANRPEYMAELNRRNKTIDSLKSLLNSRTKTYFDNNVAVSNKAGDNGIGVAVFNLQQQVQEAEVKLSSLELSRTMIYNTLTTYESKFERLPKQTIFLASLTRDKEFNEKLVTKIGDQLEEALMAEMSTFGQVEIFDYAAVPDTPYSPRIVLNLGIGALLGIIFGIFTAFMINFFFHYVRSPQDVEALGFRLLSTIPRIQIESPNNQKLLADGSKEREPSLIASERDYSIALESFHRLHIYLKYAFVDKEIKSLVVTSAGPGEGKSATASNLAITLANSGQKVLLVDADLRKPAIDKYFNIDPTPSLAHYLFRKKSLDEIIRTTHVPNLDIITCVEFPQNPSIVLSSNRMKKFMEIVNARYDFVIYDTSPVNAVSDAIHVAKNVDEVILIARAEKTNMEELNRASKLFKEFHINVGGVVLNDYDDSKLSSYYGKHYAYYSKSNDNGKKKRKSSLKNTVIIKPETFEDSSEYEIVDSGSNPDRTKSAE